LRRDHVGRKTSRAAKMVDPNEIIRTSSSSSTAKMKEEAQGARLIEQGSIRR